jgi:hypothetical protein
MTPLTFTTPRGLQDPTPTTNPTNDTSPTLDPLAKYAELIALGVAGFVMAMHVLICIVVLWRLRRRAALETGPEAQGLLYADADRDAESLDLDFALVQDYHDEERI